MKKLDLKNSSLLQKSALWAALSLSMIGSAQALTLMPPVVQSKVGEALYAEIDITQMTQAERINLQVNLASQEIFRTAKFDVPNNNGAPLDIRVEVLYRDPARPYIRVTSKQPITESNLELMMDIRWHTGRQLRGVTMSLDDPKLTPKTSTALAVADTPAPAKVNTPINDNAAQALANRVALARAALEKAAADRAAADRSAADRAAADRAAADRAAVEKPVADRSNQKILVKRGDTASELVVNEVPSDVSLDQMLVALLRGNPDAFVASNVNRLKSGVLLTLPSAQEAKAISRDTARREVQVQTKDFEAYRAALAVRAPGGAVPKVARDAAGKLETKLQDKNAKTSQDKLTLSKPGSTTSAADKIAQQRETKEAADRAAELNRNITELGKIAAASAAAQAASEPAAGALPVNAPQNPAANQDDWLTELSQNIFTPIGAFTLIVILLLVGLRYRRIWEKPEPVLGQGMSPLNDTSNSNFPEFNSEEPVLRRYVPKADADNYDARVSENRSTDEPAPEDQSAPAAQSFRAPLREMPNISLDLDAPETSVGNYQVRIDLANELWNLGQFHTSRALMEEVATEATGVEREHAIQWLAERG